MNNLWNYSTITIIIKLMWFRLPIEMGIMINSITNFLQDMY